MMTAVEFIHAELKRLHGMLDKAIGDLTPSLLFACTYPARRRAASVNTTSTERSSPSCIPSGK